MVLSLVKALKKSLEKMPSLGKPKSRVSLTKAPIEKIRCQVKPFSQMLEFSGKPIYFFPPCKFYGIYLINPEEAYNRFFEWYHHSWFELKAWEISKEDGGMRNGSLSKLICDLHKEAGINISCFKDAKHCFISKAIDLRVEQYFSLLNSIRKDGFDKSLRPPIKSVFKNGLYYLKGGHHRVSILYNLGFQEVDLKVVS